MNLDQQKKRARALLLAVRSADAHALSTIQTHQPRWANQSPATIAQQLSLHDALYVTAREQGFPSWTRLKAYATNSTHPHHAHLFTTDLRWLLDRVHGLMLTRHSAGPAALEQIREWHPAFTAATDEAILAAPFTPTDAQLVYARQHGFATWHDLTQRLAALAAQPPTAAEPFLLAFQSLSAPSPATLAQLLTRHHHLPLARGTNGNTLLNLAVSLAAKFERPHAQTLIQTLLDAGADPNAANDRGWTPLHQAAYSNQHDLASLLLAHGADPEAEAHGSGGTPLIIALFWGHREAASLLAQHSLAPANLRVAAGLGHLDLLDTLLPLNSAAAAARGFYRPHSGFPDWQPSTDPQEVLDEALVWAARSGNTAAMPHLLAAGANPNADPYRGTPLIWAAVGNHIAAATWLIDNGADINLAATFGGATHGQGITALIMAAQYGHLPMVQHLISHGADPTLRDHLYNATAASAASYFGHPAVSNYLNSID
jgi:ankyrin repeat protein